MNLFGDAFLVILFNGSIYSTTDITAMKDTVKNELANKIPLINDTKEVDMTNGVDKIIPDHKIIGGWSATSGMLPYQASVMSFTTDGNIRHCGGTLITRRHVLTAAHCLLWTEGAIVTLGGANQNLMFGPGIQTYLVDGGEFILHPDYDDSNYYNDIAIIRLPTSVDNTFTIRPVSLPTKDMTVNDFFANMTALISGYGKTSDHWFDKGSDKLMMAYANITTFSECYGYLKTVYRLRPSQICTRFNGTGTCQGDSGGPLVVAVEKRNYIVGITSFGEKRCLKRFPSIYTNVPYFLDWIQTAIKLR